MKAPTGPLNTLRHASAMGARENQTFRLPDGRLLGYADYGDPTGKPVFFFHGFPSSRLEAFCSHKIARQRHIRIIAPDRPGFGLSTFQPNYRITDWPVDVQAVANHLDIPRFAVLGSSGGAPYALACAHALPSDILLGVGVVSGAGAWDAGTQDIPWRSRATAAAAAYWPSGLRVVAGGLIGALRWTLTTGVATRRIDGWLEELIRKKKESAATTTTMETGKEERTPAEQDEDELTIADRRERILRTGFEGFAQGAEAMVQEAQLQSGDWGFKLGDVAYDPILLWHGTQDTQAPVQWIRAMAERLPYGILKEYDGETHGTMFLNRLEEVFSDLVPEETREADGDA
jgi:pimeloyl-ACP methyl ester carboxylesterase